MATITSLGSGSGLELQKIVDSLKAAEETKLTAISAKKEANDTKISAFGSISSAMSNLADSIRNLGKNGVFKSSKVSFTGAGISASATSSAAMGTFTVKATSVAKAQAITSAGQADKAAAITGAGTFNIKVGAGANVAVVIPEGSTLNDIAAKINAAGAGVTASIVNVGGVNPYRLSVTSSTTGTTNAITQSFVETSAGDLTAAMSSFSTTTAASDAVVEMNGLTVTSPTNKIVDAMTGVTFTVTSPGAEQTFTVAQDSDAIKSSIKDFVSKYNEYSTTMQKYMSFNADTKTAGLLLGDNTARTVQQRVVGLITAEVTGATGSINKLNQLGIRLDEKGMLKLDEAALDKVLATKPEDVSLVFAGTGNLGSDGFSYQATRAMDKMLAWDGMIKSATDGLYSKSQDFVDAYEKQEAQIESMIDRYRKQFSNLDSLVTSMNSTMSLLTNTANQWAKSS